MYSELREFNLKLAFASTRMRSKDIQNELRAVDYARIGHTLYVALLGSSEIVVEKQQIGGGRRGSAGNFLQFALAD